MKHFTIAIDGPGGAGKSSVADHVAKELSVPHLDTGAMYRAFGYQAIAEGLDARNEADMDTLAARAQMDVRFDGGKQYTLVNGQDVTDKIRTPEVSMAASDCAVFGSVRRLMVRLQQQIASRQSIILDGRDIGTRVLPDATLKIFLTASPEVRAQRRYQEILDQGGQPDYQDVLNDVIIRDKQDSTRAIDPLRAAEDAVTLDTSHLTQREVEEKILLLLHETLDKQAKKREPLTLFYRVAMWVSTFLFHVLYPVRYHDIENAQIDAPYILVGNHSHFLDPLLVGWKINRYQIRYLGKKELIKHPLMKGLYRNMLMIPVDRHNMDMGALRACLKTLKEGHVLGIFPEGTRYKKTLMEEMESGVAVIALRGGVPILPVYVATKPKPFHRTDCYYGKPFTVTEIAQKGLTRETSEEVLQLITQKYREMARHAAH